MDNKSRNIVALIKYGSIPGGHYNGGNPIEKRGSYNVDFPVRLNRVVEMLLIQTDPVGN